MVRIGRTDKVSLFRADFFNEILKVANHLVGICLGRNTKFGSLCGNFVAMFVSAYLEPDSVAILHLIAHPDVSEQVVERVADMRLTIDVRNSSSDVEIFSHWRPLYPNKARDVRTGPIATREAVASRQ